MSPPSPPPPSPLLRGLDARPGDAPAISDATGSHDWATLRRLASHGAGALARLTHGGARTPTAGPRIGLLVEPGLHWMAAALAIWRAGAVVVPLSPRYPDRELSGLLQDADATALVVSPAWKRPDLALPQPTTEQLFVAPAVPLAPPPPAAEGDIAMLLYTSGTTGRSKGVQLTHRCLAHQAALLAACWELNPSTRLLHTLPLHHMHGIAIALLPTLLAGGSAALCARFDAEQVWALFGEGVTFMGVPTMYHRLVEAFDRADDSTRARWQGKARALALATSGSAALPVGLAKRWREIAGAIPLERYGMTEVGVLCSNPVETNARRVGWVGTALPTLELSLRDDDGNIIEAEHGEARLGEIWVRGPSLFSGYWRRADADAKAFSDGWFRTGDRGERDDDGCVRILGRRSVDILKSGGYKLSALEIEEIFREHPAIADVAVVGLPDEALGQRVAAAVVAHDGRTNECAGELLELWARERLAGYKLPRVYRVVDALPRNTLGKVLKKQVVALLDETISCPD